MECSQLNPNAGAPNSLAAIYQNANERAQGQEQMDRAMSVAELVLEAVARLRNTLNIASHAVNKVLPTQHSERRNLIARGPGDYNRVTRVD